ncbi:MAG: UDP-glucose 4-epimerase GalE [Thiohalomonadales bacterium]
MKVLVVGGAGYIGSHMVVRLLQDDVEVMTFDNLSGGYRDSVLGGDFIKGDLADTSLLNKIFSENNFDVVMHFASFIEVGESIISPAKYYFNNVTNTQNLLDAMVQHGVLNFIFSSTAAIFGEPQYVPIDEKHPMSPINPYGRTKLIVEHMLADYDRAYRLKSVALRYFNAAGADPETRIGERHVPESHLIPLVLQAASGRRDFISIFGQDYDTPDGTCVRDYIHICDLCEAHLLAIKALQVTQNSSAYNLGNGNGFSVKEVIDTAMKVTTRNIKVKITARRSGDPARLVADAALARQELNWKPAFSSLETIIEHAWLWEEKLGS